MILWWRNKKPLQNDLAQCEKILQICDNSAVKTGAPNIGSVRQGYYKACSSETEFVEDISLYIVTERALKRGELPSIDGLVAFVAAAEHGSFTRAADQLNLSQGAISRQVRDIEIHLGVRLFERVRQRIMLTDAGRLYLPQVKKLLRDLADAGSSVQSLSSNTSLNIVALPTFAGFWLVPRLSLFQKQNPAITIHVTTWQPPIDYSHAPFDAAVLHTESYWPGTISYHLFDEDMVVVANPTLQAGQAIKAAADVTKFTLLHNVSGPRRWIEWMSEARAEIDCPLHGHTYQNYAMVVQAAAAGVGLALLPRYLVEDGVAAKQLEIVANGFAALKTSYHLILPETRVSSYAVESFAKWLIAEAQAFKTTNGRRADGNPLPRRTNGKQKLAIESPSLANFRADA
jgi:LysR family glycine cleavage system transcriptional activator